MHIERNEGLDLVILANFKSSKMVKSVYRPNFEKSAYTGHFVKILSKIVKNDRDPLHNNLH